MKRWFGVIAVTAIVGIAAALAGFNVWFHYNQSRQIHALWGSESLMLIAHAPKVELVELYSPMLEKSKPAVTSCRINGWHFRTENHVDISDLPGLSNFRYALGQDASYEWGNTPADRGGWSRGIRFSDENSETIVVFDTDEGMASAPGDSPPVRFTEKMNDGLKLFIAKFPPPAEIW